MENFSAFTLKSEGIMDMLKTDVIVLSNARDKTKPYVPKKWRGLWDTGASKSSITQRIADDLALSPIGQTGVSTANGVIIVNTYFVDIVLLNGVVAKNVLVCCSNLGDDIDVLIGMDIITHGDFPLLM